MAKTRSSNDGAAQEPTDIQPPVDLDTLATFLKPVTDAFLDVKRHERQLARQGMQNQREMQHKLLESQERARAAALLEDRARRQDLLRFAYRFGTAVIVTVFALAWLLLWYEQAGLLADVVKVASGGAGGFALGWGLGMRSAEQRARDAAQQAAPRASEPVPQ